MLIRKDDLVVVITGDDKGPEPRKVIRSFPSRDKVLVEGVNRVYKHLKPSQRNQQGGRLSKEMPIAVSNVMFYNSALKRPVRLGVRIDESGRKERYCKVSNQSLGPIGKVKPSRVSAKSTVKSE
jgi:large subunit ribosomal protein L24